MLPVEQALATPTAEPSAEPVVLRVVDCPDAPAEDVKQLAALELSPRFTVVPAEDTAARLTGSLRCDPGAPVVITVDDPKRSAPLRIELDLERTAPAARTRLLALTLAELIATSRLERPEAGAQPKPEPAARVSPLTDVTIAGDLAPAPTARPLPQTQLWLAPGFSRTGAPATNLFGVDAGGAQAIGGLALSAELQARWGTADLDDADVNVRAFSLGVALGPRFALGEIALSAAPGLRAGYGRLSADPQRSDLRGDTLAGAWFGPFGVAAAQLNIAGPSALRLAIEVGYTARSLVGNDEHAEDLMAIRGLWVSAAAGVALDLR